MRHAKESRDRWGVDARLVGVLVLLLVVLAVLGLARVWGAPVAMTVPEPTGQSMDPSTSSSEEPASVIVYVSGAVKDPGIKGLTEGDRVADALEAAGGSTLDSLPDSLNLARPLVDGEQIHVGTADAGQGLANPTEAAPNCVDINQASAGELQELSGIGPALAERVIAHRQEHGRFADNQALQEVSGIGPKTYEGFEDELCG